MLLIANTIQKNGDIIQLDGVAILVFTDKQDFHHQPHFRRKGIFEKRLEHREAKKVMFRAVSLGFQNIISYFNSTAVDTIV